MALGWLSVQSADFDALKDALNGSGWIDGEVVAAGQLRQGKAPTTASMVTGAALWEVLRPRRSKLLPRHFVLALTADRAIAFKAVGGSPQSGSVRDYTIRIKSGEEASFARSEVSLSDLPEGPESKGGIMSIRGQSFPVGRPNLNGDPNTDELIALLAA
ncbi:MAG: hypothetical protein QOJ14_408 [Thermoleophilaceae bacterium]|jgi:hypothetical protein|nr:hypothetical protein [Thermoleophilaceae bacterium]